MNRVIPGLRRTPLRTVGYQLVAWPSAVLLYVFLALAVAYGTVQHMLSQKNKKEAPPP